MILTGKQIKETNKHPQLLKLDDESEYKYLEKEKETTKGYKDCSVSRVATEAEKQAKLNNTEIQELNQWLDVRRNIEHPDKASKQARLLELLG